MIKPRLLLVSTALAAAFSVAPAKALEGVVASIKPVHSLVSAVMEGVAVPQLLVGGAGSPHTYSMRPSEAGMLEQAKVVFWIGPGLEVFLDKSMDSLARDARVVALSETPGLTLLDMREGGAFEAHGHNDEDDHDHAEGDDHHHAESDGHEHAEDDGGHEAHAGQHEHDDHGGKDMHLWLDPENARLMARQIAATLSEADPGNAAAYAANVEELGARLDALVAEMKELASGVSGKPFIVFHDAYHYFENRFGLEAAGTITVSPEVMPGAQRLQDIREKIAELGAACVFAEPQFEPKLISVVTEETDARSGVLDPLGADIDDGPELYFTLIRKMGRSLTDCLSGS